MSIAFKQNIQSLHKASDRLKNSEKFIKKLIKIDPKALFFAS
jgi:hypothetical protein